MERVAPWWRTPGWMAGVGYYAARDLVWLRGCGAVTTVSGWTGREAALLRKALRLSVRDFAAHLGVGTRTVNKWEARQSASLRCRTCRRCWTPPWRRRPTR